MSVVFNSSLSRRVVFAIACALCFAICITADPVNRKAFEDVRLRHDKKLFHKVTGSDPTLDRLIASINTREADGLGISEVVSALGIVKTMDDVARDPRVVSAIESCYAQNSSWLIQVKCAEALLDLAPTRGMILAEKIMRSDRPPEKGKLMMCHSLIRAGVLSYYGFVSDIYLKGSDHQKLLAREVIREFEQYNGRAWNDKGDKIDTDQLLSMQRDIRPSAKSGGR